MISRMNERTLITPGLRNRTIFLRAVLLELSGLDAFGKDRSRASSTARMMVAQQLYKEGNSELDIARVLGRNHSTIHYYRVKMDLLNLPGYEAERDIWKKFKERL